MVDREAMGLLLSLSFTPIFIARYLIGSHPALLLITALAQPGILRLARCNSSNCPRSAAFHCSPASMRHPEQKDDWRAVASFLEKRDKDLLIAFFTSRGATNQCCSITITGAACSGWGQCNPPTRRPKCSVRYLSAFLTSMSAKLANYPG